MGKATAAAAIAGGVLLAVVGAVGTVALVVAGIVGVYDGGVALWGVLPLLFVAGVAATVRGVVAVLREATDVAGDPVGGFTDVADVEGVRDLRRLDGKLD